MRSTNWTRWGNKRETKGNIQSEYLFIVDCIWCIVLHCIGANQIHITLHSWKPFVKLIKITINRYPRIGAFYQQLLGAPHSIRSTSNQSNQPQILLKLNRLLLQAFSSQWQSPLGAWSHHDNQEAAIYKTTMSVISKVQQDNTKTRVSQKYLIRINWLSVNPISIFSATIKPSKITYSTSFNPKRTWFQILNYWYLLLKFVENQL